jgi:hypothetical protein
MVLGASIGLPKLVQYGTRALCVDGGNLGHDLAIVGVRLVELGTVAARGFGRADLGWTSTAATIVAFLSPIWREAANVEHVLIVYHSAFSQVLGKELKALSVTCVHSVSTELLHSTVRHLLCLLDLSRVKLDLSRVGSSASTRAHLYFLRLFVRVHITVVIVTVSCLLLRLL